MLFPSKEEKEEREKTIKKGKQAKEAQPYIMGIIEELKKDIYNKLANTDEDTYILRGQAIILNKIESEIQHHIRQGEYYQKSLSKK